MIHCCSQINFACSALLLPPLLLPLLILNCVDCVDVMF